MQHRRIMWRRRSMDSKSAACACIACCASCWITYHLQHFSQCPCQTTAQVVAERAGPATSHVICSYNKAVTAAVKAATPLMAAALAADFALARRQRNLKPGTWSGCYWQSVQWKRQQQQGTSNNTVHLDGASGKPATSPIDYCHAAA